MKWYGSLILSVLLVFGASVSRGEWRLQIHQGSTVVERALADIDSVTFHDHVIPPVGMILIPAGTFMMGSPPGEPGRGDGETQHEVTLTRSIYVSSCEVTQEEWQAVMGWNESSFFFFPQSSALPVETVTWYDAMSYCNQRSTGGGYTPAYSITNAAYAGNHMISADVTWNQAATGYRLLTEAEWEYSCRAGSTTAFCNGGITDLAYDDPNLNVVGWYIGNAFDCTHMVNTKSPNAWGLRDMHGNVREWCWDWAGPYPENATDPTGPASGSYRVTRSGCWYDATPPCRSAARSSFGPGDTGYEVGLRVCRTAP